MCVHGLSCYTRMWYNPAATLTRMMSEIRLYKCNALSNGVYQLPYSFLRSYLAVRTLYISAQAQVLQAQAYIWFFKGSSDLRR